MSRCGSSAESSSSSAQSWLAIASSTSWPSTMIRWCSSAVGWSSTGPVRVRCLGHVSEPASRVRRPAIRRSGSAPSRSALAARRAPRAPPATSSEAAASAESSCSTRADADDRLPALRAAARPARPASAGTPRAAGDRGQRREPRGRARVVVGLRERPVGPVEAALHQRAVDPQLELGVHVEVVDGLVGDEPEPVVLARHLARPAAARRTTSSAGARCTARRRAARRSHAARSTRQVGWLETPSRRTTPRVDQRPERRHRLLEVGRAVLAVRPVEVDRVDAEPLAGCAPTRARSPAPTGPRCRRRRPAPRPTLVAITSSSRSPGFAASQRPSSASLWPPWPVGEVQNE